MGGFDPLEALREVDPNATSLDRTVASKLVRTICNRASQATLRSEAAVLVDDLSGKNSRLWELINARNDVVHGRRPADALLPYASAASDVLEQAFGRGR